MPSAFVDPDIGAWVPAPNGRVIKLLNINAQGLTEVDGDGDGKPDDTAALAALGFTDDERRKLASSYPVSQTLWRVPMTHLSRIDLNFPHYAENSEPAGPGS